MSEEKILNTPKDESKPEASTAPTESTIVSAEQVTNRPIPSGQVKYAGFWIRLVAVLIDAFILGMFFDTIQAITGIELIQTYTESGNARTNLNGIGMIVWVIYYTATTGSQMQATFGKKILGLKVIRADGSKITYLRAFGRVLAKFLSAITFLIGYIMTAFTKEKKSLHDMVADTRVVYAKSVK